MCHGGVFERVLVPECSQTHTCAVHGLCVSAPPESALSNWHDVNVSRPLHMVSHLSHVGCNTPSQTRVFIIILKRQLVCHSPSAEHLLCAFKHSLYPLVKQSAI